MKPINSTPDWSPLQTGEEDPLAGIANAPVSGTKKPAGSPNEARVTDRIDIDQDSDPDRGKIYPDRSTS